MEIFLFLSGEALVTSQAIFLSPKGQDPLFPLLQAVTICGWIKGAVASPIIL